jgi:hypothetical protein
MVIICKQITQEQIEIMKALAGGGIDKFFEDILPSGGDIPNKFLKTMTKVSGETIAIDIIVISSILSASRKLRVAVFSSVF